VLEMLSEAMPAVRRMGFASHAVGLDFLRNFRNLQSLATDRRSHSTPSRASEILRSLEHLEELDFSSWDTINRKSALDPLPLETVSFPDDLSNGFSEILSTMRVLWPGLSSLDPNGVALVAHCTSLEQLNLYFPRNHVLLTKEKQLNIPNDIAEALTKLLKLNKINFYNKNVGDWRDPPSPPSKPLSIRNQKSAWFLMGEFHISEVRQLIST
jgi:hypothetical protein